MSTVRMRHFLFGKDISPWWFLDKVEHKFVEYIFEKGKVIGCRFYDVRGKEITKAIGELITVDMLYEEEPERNGGK